MTTVLTQTLFNLKGPRVVKLNTETMTALKIIGTLLTRDYVISTWPCS